MTERILLEELLFDSQGNLYGTTGYGGNTGGYGVAYELQRGANGQWTEAVLYNFKPIPDAGNPGTGALVFDKAGNLYGTTTFGGSSDQGAVYAAKPRTERPVD